MTEDVRYERYNTAQSVGAMLAWYFVEASKSDNFYQTAVEGLVELADSLLADADQNSLNVVIGALARLRYTYHRPNEARS